MAAASFQLQILQPIYYDQIRQAIDVSLDANAIPDAVIEQIDYGPEAESRVLARDPLALTYESTDAARWALVTRATVLLTAALLAPAMPQIAGEGLGDYKVSLHPMDMQARAAALYSRANQALSLYLNDGINLRGAVTPLPSVWLARGGGRAR